MSIKTTTKFSYDAQRLLEQWDRVPDFVLEGMARGIDLQNELTIGFAQERKLSQRGRTSLGVRTGRLRRSMRRNRATHGAGVARGSFGSNVEYLGAHEFGFRGAVRVKAHTRQGKAGPHSVKPHTRQVNFPARRMIRTSIERRLGAYSREMSHRVITAWRKAHGI